MKSGQQVYSEMHDRIEAARTSAAASARELDALTAQLTTARSTAAEQTAALARLRLDLLAANQVASGLDAADQRALALLAQRGQRFDALHGEIDASVAIQKQRTEARAAALAEHDRQLAAIDTLVQHTRLALVETAAHKLLQQAADDAELRARHADEKADQAESDRSAKRLPYEADRLFMYLWQRRYAFPEYAAMPLIRTLDGWVARLIKYDAAHRNYRMLLALADRMREHAERQQDDAGEYAERLAEADEQALDAAGVPPLADALNRAGDALAAAELDLEAEETRHQNLLAERADIAAGNDALTIEAIKVLETQINAEDITRLRGDAQLTSSAKDDAIVAKLANLRAEASTLATRVATLQATQKETLTQLERMQELRVRFRNSTYDSKDSEFNDGLAIGPMLDNLLRGAVLVNEVWNSISREQAFRIPRSSSGNGWGGGSSGRRSSSSSSRSSSSRSSSSSSSRSSGGFRSGGSFGGGGFKTGGGF